MKLRQSLTALVLGGSSFILLLLVLSYTLWARENYFRALDTSFSVSMHKAEELINAQGFEPVAPGLAIIDAQLFRQYQALPESIKLTFSKQELQVGKHYYADGITQTDKAQHRDYFIYTAEHTNSGIYYLVQQYEESETASYWDIADSQLQQIWTVSVIVTLLLVILIVFCFRYLAKPIYRLNTWSKQLSSSDLDTPIPSFGYRELDRLAEQIIQSLRQVDNIYQRESQFLQFASHELRTPITVIKSNAALLEQLISPVNMPVLQRIIRASNTMHHLTETLLWLTRKEIAQSAASDFQLNSLINELIEEHSYLLKGKAVKLQSELSTVTVLQPKTLVRIVAANLIRNAMQHIDEGMIIITLTSNRLTIENNSAQEAQLNSDASKSDNFGLGLKLVQQICEQQNWQLTIQTEPLRYLASLTFSCTGEHI
ncbi:two-component sensor histidine kinase [Shewanella sairae]|uniref:histidine kinase n=1 Tax=Shewanella sairae TaxID=190310 RepID=A0ABQ4PNI2_9GAMM|nr:HAMP domain-containing sensor histidine kinase [Shewanella sairae]MCL1130968.1 HAMP domain-containing histidine kinase [Shewanella sairae]GIU49985.1 two-component sensor histidine kinase [Shewanella sairae]